MHVIFEWDEAKRRHALALRGVDFAAMERFDWSSAVIRPDRRQDYGEVRLRAMGLIDGRLHEAVFTPRGGKVRIISLRKANARERRLWDAR
jgi:uncharacterized DUF497 family protein